MHSVKRHKNIFPSVKTQGHCSLKKPGASLKDRWSTAAPLATRAGAQHPAHTHALSGLCAQHGLLDSSLLYSSLLLLGPYACPLPLRATCIKYTGSGHCTRGDAARMELQAGKGERQ